MHGGGELRGRGAAAVGGAVVAVVRGHCGGATGEGRALVGWAALAGAVGFAVAEVWWWGGSVVVVVVVMQMSRQSLLVEEEELGTRRGPPGNKREESWKHCAR